MSQFINPLSDMGFKRIFGQEENKAFLLDFLNITLKGEIEIRDIRYLDKEILPAQENERTIVYDVYCITESGEYVIVEMQKANQANFRKRTSYYQCRAVVLQGERGNGWKYDIKTVYGIFIIDSRFNADFGKLRTDLVTIDRDTGEPHEDVMRSIFIQLPYFTKTEAECETDFDCWIYILKNMQKLEKIPFIDRNVIFGDLAKVMDVASLSRADRMRYERSLKIYRDNLAAMEYREQIGLERGEKRKQTEIARNMRAKGSPIDFIVEVTGLSAKEVEKL